MMREVHSMRTQMTVVSSNVKSFLHEYNMLDSLSGRAAYLLKS